jgi:hypothetical protein
VVAISVGHAGEVPVGGTAARDPWEGPW